MNSTKRKISANSFSTYIEFFFIFLGGLAFLGIIHTRVYTKRLPRYQTVQKCAIPTKHIFHHLEQVKVKSFGGKGGSTSTLDGVYHCKIDERSEWVFTKLNEWRGWYFFGIWVIGDLLISRSSTPLLRLLGVKFNRHPINLTTRRQLNFLLITPC